MDPVLRRATVAVSVHLVAAGLLLVGVGLVAGGGLAAIVGLAALTGLLAAAQRALARADRLPLTDRPVPVADAWVAAALAVAVTVAFAGASRGELRSLGGLVALVGLLNYFVRPIYLGAWLLVERALA